MVMYLTWLDSNSWLIEMGGQRILLDPWLVGSLTFGGQNWLIKGDRVTPRPIPDAIDLILLSQGLEDHAHPPTLQALDHATTVVASPNAATVVQALGYSHVTALPPGETVTLGQLQITAVPGSQFGPGLIENAYILRDLQNGASLYYEPHGSHAASLSQFAPIDVVLTPIVDIALPLIGPILKGGESAIAVAEGLRPQVMVPTAQAGDVIYTGVLAAILKEVGSVEAVRQQLAAKGLPTQIIQPQPGDRVEIPLSRPAVTAL